MTKKTEYEWQGSYSYTPRIYYYFRFKPNRAADRAIEKKSICDETFISLNLSIK